MFAGISAVVILAAVIIAAAINQANYSVLFSEVTQDEAYQIVAKLQDSGIDYQYKDNGDILVPNDIVDETRASLAYEGYPSSGFTYDIFIDNAGGMTSDTEKQTYKLYELQDRIGATIRLFEGVQDAKVTIALAETNTYVLSSSANEESKSSASVVVTMKDGGSPTAKQAEAIQRLVARSVTDMSMDNVSVFDGNGFEVSPSVLEDEDAGGDAAEEIAQIIETQIAKKVINVLEPFYGSSNIRVSARGKVNMEKIVRETITYNTPEKIDENDKTGIISSETTTRDSTGSTNMDGGVVGTETNSDQTEYNTSDNGDDTVISESATRDYLVNQIIEQGELDPGVLEDLTISVSINSDSLNNITMNQLRDLVGNAAGIDAEDREAKITIVNAPFYQTEEETPVITAETIQDIVRNYFPFILLIAIPILLLFILLILLLTRGKKKRTVKDPMEGFFMPEEKPGIDLTNLQNEKSRELRESIRGFADENPEISAQMIRNWLNGGNQDGSSGSAS
jgi:flagellar M-ring protein FliF